MARPNEISVFNGECQAGRHEQQQNHEADAGDSHLFWLRARSDPERLMCQPIGGAGGCQAFSAIHLGNAACMTAVP